jgi:hypothetical protein
VLLPHFVINSAAADNWTVLMPPADHTSRANAYSSAGAALILQLCTPSDNLL